VVRNHAYHPKFGVSYSIKNVLPALVPGMTYEGMEVANGTDAGLAWGSLIRGGLDQAGRDRIRKALLDCYGQDTLAMLPVVRDMGVKSQTGGRTKTGEPGSSCADLSHTSCDKWSIASFSRNTTAGCPGKEHLEP
jgi:hypothetical protein